jgi:hypothetical protein
MEATRTLVKSPPELWAELSDVAALTRHLGEFGEIRITRTEPESVVEWEGDRASGSVRLEPSGWGTRVTLIVDPSVDTNAAAASADLAEVAEPADETTASPDAAEAGPDADDVAGSAEAVDAPDDVGGSHEAVDAAGRGEVVDTSSADAPTESAAPEPDATPRRGFFARLFRWRSRRAAAKAHAAEEEAADEAASADEAEPAAAGPASVAADEPPPADAEMETSQERADETEVDAGHPVAVAEDPAAAATEAADPRPPAPAEPDAAAILAETLDALGAAHHRPFSR